MDIFFAIIAVLIYILIVHYAEKIALKNKAFKFIGCFILIATFPIMMAYYYSGEELGHYESALHGEYFIYKPTDAEYDEMLAEMDAQEIKRDEKILQLRKSGLSKDDAEYEAFENEDPGADFSYIANKYPGHNPPKEIIEKHISEMKEARTERVITVSIGIFIIYCFIWKKKLYKNRDNGNGDINEKTA